MGLALLSLPTLSTEEWGNPEWQVQSVLAISRLFQPLTLHGSSQFLAAMRCSFQQEIVQHKHLQFTEGSAAGISSPSTKPTWNQFSLSSQHFTGFLGVCNMHFCSYFIFSTSALRGLQGSNLPTCQAPKENGCTSMYSPAFSWLPWWLCSQFSPSKT